MRTKKLQTKGKKPVRTANVNRMHKRSREKQSGASRLPLATAPRATDGDDVSRSMLMRKLQRSVGNSQLNRMLDDDGAARQEEDVMPSLAIQDVGPVESAKRKSLSVVDPADSTEKEAEDVAQRVAAGKSAPDVMPMGNGKTGRMAMRTEDPEVANAQVQRTEETTEPAARMSAGDEVNRAAEEAAQAVSDEPAVGRQPEETAREEEEPVARNTADDTQTHRQATDEEAGPTQTQAEVAQSTHSPETEQVQARQGSTSRAAGIDTAAAADLISQSGSGTPLDPVTQQRLESKMGADFSRVRVHQGKAANEAAKALRARAFTRGSDIYFAEGESPADHQLLAHEVTHVIQQGHAEPGTAARATDPQVQTAEEEEVHREKSAAAPAAEGASIPGIIELKGTREFPAEKLDRHFEGRGKKPANVNVSFGRLAKGSVPVKRTGGKKPKYLIDAKQAPIPLNHPLFQANPDAALTPSLMLKTNRQGQISGQVAVSGAKEFDSAQLKKAPEMLGLVGFQFPNKLTTTNKLKDGTLTLGVESPNLRFASAFTGKIKIEAIDDDKMAFEANASIQAKRVQNADLQLKRSAEGVISGRVNVALDLPKNFSGGLDASWDGKAFKGEGKVGYAGEKLSGNVTLQMMEKGAAKQLKEQKTAPSEQGEKPGAPKKAKKEPKKIDYVLFGEGDLTFAFTDWLNGTANVIVDPEGHVTIIGKITPQREFELFPQKDYNKHLFKLEARAAYGIPVVGNIFVFGNIGMDAFAKIGPAKFYKIVVEGTYSTDPKQAQDFSIRGSLNMSAAAGLRMRAEAGVGLEIVSHDIKAGAGINGTAGVKGYAEATPVIGYREKKGDEPTDKKGEFYIRGDVEVAGQPFLGLSGDLFVELDSPWWSPAPDKKWTWPLGNKEWPIGGSFGLNASVDYVFSSGVAPAVEFKPVDFSADKFLTDMYSDKAQAKSGKKDQKGSWKEKNSKEAAAPPKEGKKGSAQEGKAAVPPPAKSKVSPGGPKKAKKAADPNKRLPDGKTVKEHQDAARKGKQGAVRAPQGAASKPTEKAKGKRDQTEQIKIGLAALDAINKRNAKTGATSEQLKREIKAVPASKFKAFKSIDVVADGNSWDYLYVYNPGERKDAVPNVAKLAKFEDRFEQAQSLDKFRKKFTTGDWASHFFGVPVDDNAKKANARRAQKDLQKGRGTGKVIALGRQGKSETYILSPLSESEIISVGTREVLLRGRSAPALSKPTGFKWQDIKAFMVAADRLPNAPDIYSQELCEKVLDQLVTKGDAEKVKGGKGEHKFKTTRAVRKLPDDWDADDIRLKYYLNGSGFWSKRDEIRTKGLEEIEKTVEALKSGTEQQMARARKKWASLHKRKVVPDKSWVAGKNYLAEKFEVDHDTPLAWHWVNKDGNNSKWDTRKKIGGDPNNLALILKSENKKKQAEGAHFRDKWWVGPNFTGPGSKRGPEFADEKTRFQLDE